MYVRRIFDSSFQNILVDFDRRSTIPEWSETAEHFEDEDT